MALEQRNGNVYYYQYIRDGESGAVRKLYAASGADARRFAEIDALRKAEKKARADRERKDRERVEATMAPVLELEDIAQVLARAHLVAGGYRRVKGEWRMPKYG